MTEENSQNTETPRKFAPNKRITMATMEASTNSMIIIGNKLEKYYTDFIGMSPALFGSAHLLYAIVNSFNDPILGYFFDRSKKKRKISKYKRFLLLAIPLYLLGMILQLAGQPGMNEILLFLCVFLGYSIFDTGYAMTNISTGSIIIRSNTYDSDRAKYVGLRLAIKAVIGVAGFLLPAYFLIENVRSEALIMFICFGIVGLAVYSIPAATLDFTDIVIVEEPTTPEFKRTLRQMLSLKSYVLYMLIAFLITGIVINQESFILYFTDGVLELTSTQAILVSGSVLPFMIGVNLFAGRLIRKFGAVKLGFVVIFLILVGNVAALLDYSMIISILGLSISLTAGTFWWTVRFTLIGQIIDEYSETFGERIEGMFMGIDSIFNAPASSVIVFIFSWIITQYGYDGLAEVQTDHAKLGKNWEFLWCQ
jgi:Na+/melibiose symporter-like transporter